MSEAKTIAKYGRIYALANVVNRSAGLILIPLYTHYLSIEAYGVWAIVLAVTDLFSLVFGMGFSSAMGRFYFEYQDDQEMRNAVVSTTMICFLGLALLIVLVANPLASLVVNMLFSNQEHHRIFMLAILCLVFVIFYEIEISYAVIRKQAWEYLYMASAKAVLFMGFNIFYVVYLKLGVIGIVYAMASALGILTMVLGVLIIREVGCKFSRPLARKLVAFGLPLAPSAVANAGMRLVERRFLNSIEGAAAVGAFALANRLASLLQMFIAAPFSQIFLVRRFETMVNGEDQDVFHRIFLVFVAVISFCTIFLSLFGVEILTLVAPSAYLSAAMLIPVLCLCYILSAINRNIELGILYNKKTWVVAVIGMISLAVSFASNYYLITLYGMMGAALSYIVINVVRLLLTVQANAVFGTKSITLDWWRTAAILTVSVGSSLAIVYLAGTSISVAWVIGKTVVLALFVALLFTSPLLDKETRSELLELLPKNK